MLARTFVELGELAGVGLRGKQAAIKALRAGITGIETMQSHTAGKDSRFPNAQFFLISTPCLCLTQQFPAAGFAGRRDVSGGGRIRQSTSPQRSFVCCRGFFCDEQGSVLRPFPTLFSGQFVCAPVGSFGFFGLFLSEAFFCFFSCRRKFLVYFLLSLPTQTQQRNNR